MRLKLFNEYRPNLIQRFKLWATKLFVGTSMLDPGKAAYYRPEIFTRPYYTLQQRALHQSRSWRTGERELFVVKTSMANVCTFCITAHTALASAAESSDWTQSALAGGQEAENPKLCAMLKFVEKLTQQPWNITPQDVECLRDARISTEAIEDAVMICAVFNIGNRLAMGLDLELPSPEAMKRTVPLVRALGYALYM
jgi:uncharacterized peroxidase-related enzyme